MPIITLTSDLGDASHYPAILKGVILSRCPAVTLVDVTHDIASFDLLQAAYVLRHTFPAYPEGSIHVVAVDPEGNTDPAGVVMMHEGQYFIGPDNGTLSLICEGQVRAGFAIEREDLLAEQFPRSFRAARVLSPAAAFLANGHHSEELGPQVTLKDLRWGAPSYSDNCLRGKIIHIDKFGNAITNIQRRDFLSLKQNRRFEIFIRNIRLRRIVTTYADVPKADALAIFGEGNHLEVAMREASAAQLLGLKVNDMITIEFAGVPANT